MENSEVVKHRKAGRKPVYTEERVKLYFRAEKSFVDDLNTIYELRKKTNKDLTFNDFVLDLLRDKIGYEIYQLKK